MNEGWGYAYTLPIEDQRLIVCMAKAIFHASTLTIKYSIERRINQ